MLNAVHSDRTRQREFSLDWLVGSSINSCGSDTKPFRRHRDYTGALNPWPSCAFKLEYASAQGWVWHLEQKEYKKNSACYDKVTIQRMRAATIIQQKLPGAKLFSKNSAAIKTQSSSLRSKKRMKTIDLYRIMYISRLYTYTHARTHAYTQNQREYHSIKPAAQRNWLSLKRICFLSEKPSEGEA